MKNEPILNTNSWQANLKLWMTYFITLNIVFLYYQTTFFIGNHDWDWIKGTTQVLTLSTGMFEGRYAKFILNILLYGGQILPFINTITAFGLLALGMVMFCRYWHIEKTSAQIIIGLYGSLSPFILGWLYFPINILGNFMAVPLVAVGLIAGEKHRNLIATLCFIIALGVYPSVAELMIVGYMIQCILANKINLRVGLNILGTMILFKGILIVLSHYGIIYSDYYNLKMQSISEIGENIFQIIKACLRQLGVSIPFYPLSIKGCGAIMIITSIVSSVYTAKSKGKILGLWGCAVAATILSYTLTPMHEEVFAAPRVNFYGLNFLYVGSLAILLSGKKVSRNFGMILGIIGIILSVQQDFYAQKVWHFGRTGEQYMVDRITHTILDQTQDDKKRVPIIAGEISLRPKYYIETYDIAGPYVLSRSFVVRHIPSGMYNFYTSKPLFANQSVITEMSPELYRYLSENKQLWPSAQSLYTDEKYIILMLTAEGQKMIRAQLPK